MYGFLEVNKVAGNFHFAPGNSFHQSNVHVHDLLAFQMDSFNVRHVFICCKYISDMFFFLINEILHFIFVCFLLLLVDISILLQLSHKINRLAFGDYFPGVINPLDR